MTSNKGENRQSVLGTDIIFGNSGTSRLSESVSSTGNVTGEYSSGFSVRTGYQRGHSDLSERCKSLLGRQCNGKET